MNDSGSSRKKLRREQGTPRRECESRELLESTSGRIEWKDGPGNDREGSNGVREVLTSIIERSIESRPDEFESWTRENLGVIGDFTGASRCFVLLFHDRSPNVIDETIEWCAGGTEPKVNGLRGMNMEGFPWIMQKIGNLETVRIPELSSLPPDAETERRLAASLEMHTAVFLPLARGDAVMGILGLSADSRRVIGSGETIFLLDSVAKIIASKLEQRRERQVLSETNTRLHALFASTPNPLFVIDHHRRIHRTNRAAQIFCGLTEDEMVGKRIGGLMGCVHHVNDRPDCETTMACERCVLRRTILGIFQTGEEIHGLETDLTVEGESGIEVRTVRISASHFDETDVPRIIIGLEDITERRRAEQELREQHELLAEVFENIEEGIGIVDTEERILLSNPPLARLFDETVESLTGRNILELFDEETRGVILAQSEKRRRGESSRYDLSFTSKRGERKHLHLTVSPRFDREGNYIGAFGVVWEVTRQKQAEARLLERVRRLEEKMTDSLPRSRGTGEGTS